MMLIVQNDNDNTDDRQLLNVTQCLPFLFPPSRAFPSKGDRTRNSSHYCKEVTFIVKIKAFL